MAGSSNAALDDKAAPDEGGPQGPDGAKSEPHSKSKGGAGKNENARKRPAGATPTKPTSGEKDAKGKLVKMTPKAKAAKGGKKGTASTPEKLVLPAGWSVETKVRGGKRKGETYKVYVSPDGSTFDRAQTVRKFLGQP